MKKIVYFGMALGFTLLTACSGEQKVEEKLTEVAYQLDAEKTTLKWKGSETPEDFHVGTIDITSGDMILLGDSLISGTFELDLMKIKVTDEGMPEDKKGKLAEHLQAEDFFYAAKFPKIKVKANSYKEGKLNLTLSLLGKEVTQDVAVALTHTEQEASLKGNFDLDLTSLNVPGFQPEAGSDEHIQPVISFEMDLNMKKK